MPIGQLYEQTPHCTQRTASGTTRAQDKAWRRRFSCSKRRVTDFRSSSKVEVCDFLRQAKLEYTLEPRPMQVEVAFHKKHSYNVAWALRPAGHLARHPPNLQRRISSMCAIFDLALPKLREYCPPLTRQPDFEAFWSETLKGGAVPLNADLLPVDYPVPEVQVFDVRYDGFKGARIGGWYLRPRDASPDRPVPAMVFYHGYSGSKAEVFHYLPWVLQGYAAFAVDVRGQSGYSTDPTPYSIGHVRGWMTQGILDEKEYYYRGVYVDCVRALDFVCAQPEVDPQRIGITGGSQGGGLTLAVAGLDRRPMLAMADVPFLCHFERPLEIVDTYPYREIADFIRRYPDTDERVFRTLSYCDVMNLTPDIACPTLVTVGLEDMVCPPSTVFAAYNQIQAPKHIDVFRYYAHEIPGIHSIAKFRWANYYLRGLGTPPLEG